MSDQRPAQLDLFAAVQETYAEAAGPVDNRRLYQRVVELTGEDPAEFARKALIGGQPHSPRKRAVRWMQQTLKHLGLLQRLPGTRGQWELTTSGRQRLARIVRPYRVLAFSTDLGLAVLGDCRDVFSGLQEEQVDLVLCSPVYPIRKGRAYGAIAETAYVDWLCSALEPVIACLKPGGSICLNVGPNVFNRASPSRSLYIERVVLALVDRFGLELMDRLVWRNPSAPPGPVQWASVERKQLNATYEFVMWLTPDSKTVGSDNRRVLQPHSERQIALQARGGERRSASYADGAHRIRPGSFGNTTEGRIPRNVLDVSHSCSRQKRYKRMAREHGLVPHGAPFPGSLARFLIEFLTEPGDLVVDPMAGSFTTAEESDLLGRRWIAAELVRDYALGGGLRLAERPGFRWGDALPAPATPQVKKGRR